MNPRPAPPAFWRGLLPVALIFVVTVLAYWPALRGGFVWDDDAHVTRPDLRSPDGLVRIWTEVGATQQYYPLLHSAFWLEHRLWGDAPFGYHLLNVLLHATVACLFGVILRRLAVPGGWLAPLLFALHPVGVESVAWITEQKNTLSAVFYLGAALAYLRFAAERRWPLYALATGLFGCALLTKSVTATLPAALLVVVWWQRGRVTWRADVWPLLPWFALGAVAGLFTAWVELSSIGATGPEFALSPVERALVAGRALWFYTGKLLWPADLAFVYPRWEIDINDAQAYAFPFAALALGVVLWRRSRGQRGPLAAALLFAGTLLPALGFVNVYPFLYSFVADHFQYLASLSAFALVGATAVRLACRLPIWSVRIGTVALLVILGALTWRQSAHYRDDFTLYADTLEKNPACWMAHNNLGRALAATGRVDEARSHFEAALRLRPDYAEAEGNLGDSLTRLGRPQEAIPHLTRALLLQTDFPEEIHNNLGIALLAAGRTTEGVAHFRRALCLRRDYPVACFNLGLALMKQGRLTAAIPQFERAAQLQPGLMVAHRHLGHALARIGRFKEGLTHLERAQRLAPDDLALHHERLLLQRLLDAGQSDSSAWPGHPVTRTIIETP